MTYPIGDQMGQILALTRAGKLNDATALIQRSLGSASLHREGPKARPGSPIDIRALGPLTLPEPQTVTHAGKGTEQRTAPATNMRKHSFDAGRGRLDYLLYVPSHVEVTMPLVVMLHGCTQSAQDFAHGTRMNELAVEMGFVVVYPEQTQAGNAHKCWNWFRPGDQMRDMGEPAMIAGITREIIANHAIDPARVYVAGLSAGGAAAAIMANVYPEIYAAAGIHSGLACGSARDLPSAFAAMKGSGRTRTDGTGAYVPLITFHGDRDTTVHPANSEQIHAMWKSAPELASLERKVNDAVSPAGRRYSKTALVDHTGRSFAEHWEVADAGHAWAGGSPNGSYTDSSGPDASRQMLRFFLQHRLAR
ncbi:MAG: PHB depolymerase family esterase [Pontixanthobacter sp.]